MDRFNYVLLNVFVSVFPQRIGIPFDVEESLPLRKEIKARAEIQCN